MFENITKIVSELHLLVDLPSHWREREMRDNVYPEMSPHDIKAKAERDLFIMLDGPSLLVKVLKTHEYDDARKLKKKEVMNKARCWNDCLLLLRELCYINPEVAEIFDTKLIIYLFTLLHHECCFDLAIGLIEEILTLQPASNIFFLGNVPNLYSLLNGFTCRQTAHLCRVLALLVFEPEDRMLMESSTVLRSVELLQLRRDRQGRASNTIDRNQSILIGMSNFIPRLVSLLKVMNFSPPINRLSPFHLISQVPAISDLLISLIGFNEIKKWDDVQVLEDLAKKATPSQSPSPPASGAANDRALAAAPATPLSSSVSHTPSPTLSSPAASRNSSSPLPTPSPAGLPSSPRSLTPPAPPRRNALAEMLESIAPHFSAPQTSTIGNIELIVHVLNSAQSTGILQTGAMAPNGGMWHGIDARLMDRMHELNNVTSHVRARTPERAADELQFNALVLSQFQVEVLFVICTILGGRRKIDIQRMLHDIQIVPVLESMFDRLAWGTNNADNPHNANGMHGPNCECNPESALRIQYLRVIHNFCDRDCDNYEGKMELLSEAERSYLGFSATNKEGDPLSFKKVPPHPSERGLLSKLIQVLLVEPSDSQYRFWLTSCVEAFLRGSSEVVRIYVARSVLSYLSEEILSDR